jgi:hypothetical protein
MMWFFIGALIILVGYFLWKAGFFGWVLAQLK